MEKSKKQKKKFGFLTQKEGLALTDLSSRIVKQLEKQADLNLLFDTRIKILERKVKERDKGAVRNSSQR